MKDRIAILGSLVILLIVSFCCQHVTSAETQLTNVLPTTTGTNVGIMTPKEFTKIEPELEKRRESLTEQALNEWKTPIEFYGIVMNENNSVVSGAKVDFSCDDTSPTGTSFYHTISGDNGGFSIKGIQGKLLQVSASKEGYYSYDPHGQYFYYAGQNQNFVPDAGNPVVFRLRKIGQGADLIHYDKSFKIARDGTPIIINLATGNLAPGGDNTLKVEGQSFDNDKKQGWKFDWNFRVLVPGGGLQTNNDEFPFLAPESDYLQEDFTDMTVSNNPAWTYIVHRNYYVHTAGGNFGRMVFTMVAGGDNFCEMNLYFNPTGSRNLEPAQ